MEILVANQLGKHCYHGHYCLAEPNNSILKVMSYFSDIYKGIKTLLTGMSVTGKYFLTSRKGGHYTKVP